MEGTMRYPDPGWRQETLSNATLDDLVTRARALAQPGTRRLLGVTGPPGAGKSSVCGLLLQVLADDAVLIDMDGFHLANEELVRLGRRDRKGAPDTFDVDGYTALLRRLRAQTTGVIYAPKFDRDLEESVGSAVPVNYSTPLVITEGNYLLHQDGGWQDVAPQLDESWYIEVPTAERRSRLVRRRQDHGERRNQAEAWVEGVDSINGGIVETTKCRADLIIELDRTVGPLPGVGRGTA